MAPVHELRGIDMGMRLLACGVVLALLSGCASFGGADAGRDPHRVVLQVRAGAGGGNPNRIDMNGTTSIYVRTFSKDPLDLEKPVSMNEAAVAHCNDGRLAAGQTFVVTEVRYFGTAVGDSNGNGEFKVVVGGQVLAHSRNSHLPTVGTWRGAIPIRAGEESAVFVEVANSSVGSAEILGHIESAEVVAPADR
jgi:hypothetical protein